MMGMGLVLLLLLRLADQRKSAGMRMINQGFMFCGTVVFPIGQSEHARPYSLFSRFFLNVPIRALHIERGEITEQSMLCMYRQIVKNVATRNTTSREQHPTTATPTYSTFDGFIIHCVLSTRQAAGIIRQDGFRLPYSRALWPPGGVGDRPASCNTARHLRRQHFPRNEGTSLASPLRTHLRLTHSLCPGHLLLSVSARSAPSPAPRPAAPPAAPAESALPALLVLPALLAPRPAVSGLSSLGG